jgi:hypothetical protein
MSVSIFAVVVSVFVPQAFAQVVLVSGNSLVSINPVGPNPGMNNWTVDGFNTLNLQWFWYRAGSMTSEQSIDTISAPTITPTSAHQSRIGYANNSYSVSVDYNLNGQALGSGLSTLFEVVSIRNLTSTTQTFTFFQYSDFNLGGPPGDSVLIGQDNRGMFGDALQTNGPIRLAESSVTPGANRAEASIFPNTLNSLNDGAVTVLNNSTSAGPGNATWAFEWDITLTPFGTQGDTFGISKTLDVVVPEPSAAALLTVGGVIGALVRRRKCQNNRA